MAATGLHLSSVPQEPPVPDPSQATGSSIVGAAPGPSLSPPSTDTRGDLAAIFESCKRALGSSFYFKKAYSDIDEPHPVLRVENFGHAKLPLTLEKVKYLVTWCKKAAKETNQGDAQAANAWQLDTSAVHYDSPDWEEFLDYAKREACKTLGVSFEASKPQHELDIFQILGARSHLPKCDGNQVDGVFAYMIVVLPSHFTGGALHLSQHDECVMLSPELGSSNSTTVIAWRTGVTQRTEPITSGHALAISYRLIQTNPEQLHTFSPYSSLSDSFRVVLTSWVQREDLNPFKIAYLLENHYSVARLRACGSRALKGVDARTAALLEPLARQLGFRITLANIIYSLRGDREALTEGTSDQSSYDSFEDDDSCHTKLTTTDVVDFHGNWVKKNAVMTCNDDETIPIGIGPHIEALSDFVQSNIPGDSERSYSRTFLMLWPKFHDIEIECDGDFGPTFKSLKAAGPTPYEGQRAQAEYLVRAAKADRVFHKEVVMSVCHAAVRWKDVSLWQRALAACKCDRTLRFLTEADICDAVQHLGFWGTRPILETLLRYDSRDSVRLSLLTRLQDFQEPGQAEGIPAAWIAEQRKVIAESLNKPTSYQDLELFLDIARGLHTVPYLETTVVPLVKAQAEPELMISFASLLAIEKQTFARDDQEQAAVDEMVRDMLILAISKVNYFQAAGGRDGGSVLLDHEHRGTPAVAHSCFLACVKTHNEDLLDTIADKLIEGVFQELAASNWCSNTRTGRVLLPLVLLIANTLRASPYPQPIPGIKKLCRAAVQTRFESGDVLLAVAEAVRLSGDNNLFESRIVPWLWEMGPERVVWKARLLSVVESVPPADSTVPTRSTLGEILRVIEEAEL